MGAEMFNADGQPDGHDEANSSYSQLRERAYDRYSRSKWRESLSTHSKI
jgi:hypothetical protein